MLVLRKLIDKVIIRLSLILSKGNNMMNNKKNTKDRGFTLVELIVVLVILVILAAILVPALLGYIDRAKNNQDIVKARNMLTATQVALAEYYAFHNYEDIINGKESANSDFAKLVRKTADDEPYLVIVGIGDSQNSDSNTTIHEQSTVYSIIYWESKEKNPIFFDGTNWSNEYPWNENSSGHANNFFMINGERKALNFIFISDNTKSDWSALKKKGYRVDNTWNYLQATVKDRNLGFGASGDTTKNGK